MKKRKFNSRPIFNMLCTSGAWTIYRKGDAVPNTNVQLLWWATRIKGQIVQGMVIRNHPNDLEKDIDIFDPSIRYDKSVVNEALSSGHYHVTKFKPTLRKHSERAALRMFNEAYKLARA